MIKKIQLKNKIKNQKNNVLFYILIIVIILVVSLIVGSITFFINDRQKFNNQKKLFTLLQLINSYIKNNSPNRYFIDKNNNSKSYKFAFLDETDIKENSGNKEWNNVLINFYSSSDGFNNKIKISNLQNLNVKNYGPGDITLIEIKNALSSRFYEPAPLSLNLLFPGSENNKTTKQKKFSENSVLRFAKNNTAGNNSDLLTSIKPTEYLKADYKISGDITIAKNADEPYQFPPKSDTSEIKNVPAPDKVDPTDSAYKYYDPGGYSFGSRLIITLVFLLDNTNHTISIATKEIKKFQTVIVFFFDETGKIMIYCIDIGIQVYTITNLNLSFNYIID